MYELILKYLSYVVAILILSSPVWITLLVIASKVQKKKRNNTSNKAYTAAPTISTPTTISMPDYSIKESIDVRAENTNTKSQALPYYLRINFFTSREQRFYHVLKPIADKFNLVVFPKVRLADIVAVDTKKFGYGWFGKIKAKHIDFTLCTPTYFKPILLVELDDYTHKYKSRIARDEFVDQVAASVNVPILHIYEYTAESLERTMYNEMAKFYK